MSMQAQVIYLFLLKIVSNLILIKQNNTNIPNF